MVLKLKKLNILRLVVLTLFLFFIQSSLGMAVEKYSFITKWPKVSQQEYFLGLKDIAVDTEDRLYLIEGLDVKIIDTKGKLLKKWVIKIDEYLDPDFLNINVYKNKIYITTNYIIQVYSEDGELLSTWQNADKDNEFNGIYDSVIDSKGNIYVLQQGDTIFKLDSDGQFLTKWSVSNAYETLAIDLDDNVYVADYDEGIIKFNCNGDKIKSWKFSGKEPWNITTDFLGNVYVVDSLEQRIYKYDSNGGLLANWYIPNLTVSKLATDSKGLLYIIDIDYIEKYDSSGNHIEEWGSAGYLDGKFHFPTAIGLDKQGNVYVADALNFRIQKFNPNGSFLLKWGQKGNKSGEFNYLIDIAIDKQGYVYVVDNGNVRVQKYSSSGKFITQWGKSGKGNGQFSCPIDIEIDSKGNIYVVDYINNNLQKFNSKGQFLQKWTGFGKGKALIEPIGIVIDSIDNIYVGYRNGIFKISSKGNLLADWRRTARQEGELSIGLNLAFDSKNNIYIADQMYSYIEKYSPQGKLLGKWGKKGMTDGQFLRINDIVISKSNRLYLLDDALSRVQVFKIP